MLKRTVASGAALVLAIGALSQFSVFNHYSAMDAEAAPAAYDTVTYADKRIVYLVSASIDTNIVGTDTSLFYMPDISEAPTGARGEVIWKGTHDSAMIVTADTFNLAQMDSADASTLSVAWGVRDPYTVDLAWYDPPSGGDFENEPAGMTLIVEAYFNSSPEDGWNDISDNPNFGVASTSTYNPEESSISSVSTPPYAADDSIGIARYYPSLVGGTAPMNMNMDAAYAPNSLQYNEAYWAFWLQPSINHYLGSTSVNKIGFVELGDSTASSGASQIYFALTGASTDSFHYAMFTQSSSGEPFAGRWTCDLGRVIKAGQWHKIENYVKLNSVTAQDSLVKDGVFQVWIDEVECDFISSEGTGPADTVAFRGLPFSNGGNNVISRVKWNPTSAGPQSPPDSSYQWMSHLYYSGKKTD